MAAGQLAVFEGGPSRTGLTVATSISRLIRKERATRENSQPAAARRVALKMGRRLPDRLRIGSDMRPLTASPARTASPAAHFERDHVPATYETMHLDSEFVSLRRNR